MARGRPPHPGRGSGRANAETSSVVHDIRRLEKQLAALTELVQRVVQQQAVAGIGQALPSGPVAGIAASKVADVACEAANGPPGDQACGMPLLGTTSIVPMSATVVTGVMPDRLVEEFRHLEIEVVSTGATAQLMALVVQPTLTERVLLGQQRDSYLQKVRAEIEQGKDGDFSIHTDGSLHFRGRWCVPSDSELRNDILSEAHRSSYTVHPDGTKMYCDLKKNFWWPGMKLDVVQHVTRCLVCQQMKAEHQRPAGKLQPLPVPVWKWEQITMDSSPDCLDHNGAMMRSGFTRERRGGARTGRSFVDSALPLRPEIAYLESAYLGV
uniref:Integrase zinc-binding domain-containing protein n=1 Tax=Ananas comosus var. bracteatus TaxID=296719 RepID=A0A6V7P1Q2_ANACO|nr:unnamed protein product [Ananas comosus var. bracteatus]